MRDTFRDGWAEVDPEASGFIPIAEFEKLMFCLGEKLGWPEEYPEESQKLFKEELGLKIYGTEATEGDAQSDQERVSQKSSLGNQSDMKYCFFDVLENLALLFVVKHEMEKLELEKKEE